MIDSLDLLNDQLGISMNNQRYSVTVRHWILFAFQGLQNTLKATDQPLVFSLIVGKGTPKKWQKGVLHRRRMAVLDCGGCGTCHYLDNFRSRKDNLSSSTCYTRIPSCPAVKMNVKYQPSRRDTSSRKGFARIGSFHCG